MRSNLRTVATTALVTVLAILVMRGGGLLFLVTRPYEAEQVVALGNRPAWTVTVTYRPGHPRTDVELRMDGLRRYRDVVFRVESPESWAPSWEGRLEGELSEFVTLRDAASPPTPLDVGAARALATGYRVALTVDGKPRTIEFEGFAQTEALADRYIGHEACADFMPLEAPAP